MRQKVYTIVAVLWCTVFPAGPYLMKVVIDSPDGTPAQAIAIVTTMLGLGVAAVLLEPKKNPRSANPPLLRD
jgi:hypothetical protein